MYKKLLIFSFSILAVFSFSTSCSDDGEKEISSFRYTATADNRDLHDKWQHVLSQINTISGNEGAFHLSGGDFDPTDSAFMYLQEAFGEETLFYPCFGNHELPGESSTSNSNPDENLPWFKNHVKTLPNVVKYGPIGSEYTTYSFNYGPAHFVMLNQYYDGESEIGLDGDVCDALYDWLADDLEANSKSIIFVVGHEAAFPASDNHHATDCINKYPDNRDRFWNLLKEKNVAAHLTAHTHQFLMGEYDGVIEINLGNAGQSNDWIPSDPDLQTFVDINVTTSSVHFTAYSGNIGEDFTITQEIDFVLDN